jgi:hypothetical protein
MEKALYGPGGRSRPKVALVVAGSWLFTLLWRAAASGPTWNWPTWSSESNTANAVVLAACLVMTGPFLPLALAHSSHERRQNREEWSSLDIV